MAKSCQVWRDIKCSSETEADSEQKREPKNWERVKTVSVGSNRCSLVVLPVMPDAESTLILPAKGELYSKEIPVFYVTSLQMLLGFTCISPYILMFGGKPWPAAVYLKKKNFHPFALGSLGLEKTYTVEPCPMATPLIWSHRYYSHIFLAWQNGHTFTYKKNVNVVSC